MSTNGDRMAGSTGLFGFGDVSSAPSQLEGSIIARRSGTDQVGRVDTEMEALLSTIGRGPTMLPGR
jgi:hypothetical protein